MLSIVVLFAGCGGGGGGGGVNTPADTTPPSVTAFNIPATSNSMTVPITTFTASDNISVAGYLITESSTAPTAGAAGWSTSAPSSFVFSGIGARTAYAWVKDGSGNVSLSISRVVTITLTASLSTVVNGSTAVGTISISGATLPIIYGLDLKVTYPSGVTFDSAVSYGVALAQGAPNPITNLGTNEVVISFPSTNGYGAGDVMQVNFSTLPNGTLSSQFGLELVAVYGAGGAQIQ
jgi:hypothetical protein